MDKFVVIFEDTRQQLAHHKRKNAYFKEQGYEVIRTCAYSGDYRFPGGLVMVDTKKDLRELKQNLMQKHEETRNNCIKAQKCGYQLVILTENTEGITSLADLARYHELKAKPKSYYAIKKRRPNYEPINGKVLANICLTMSKKYGVLWGFCSPKEAGKRVLDMLYGLQESFGKLKSPISTGGGDSVG